MDLSVEYVATSGSTDKCCSTSSANNSPPSCIALVENVALPSSRPRRSELRLLLALVDQIDLAGPDYVNHDLHTRLLHLIVPGPCYRILPHMTPTQISISTIFVFLFSVIFIDLDRNVKFEPDGASIPSQSS